MAAFFGGYPHEIWAWPFHYYLAVRSEYLKIHGLTVRPEQRGKVTEWAPGTGITVETYEY